MGDAGEAVVVTDRYSTATRRAPLLHLGIPANRHREARLGALVVLLHVVLTRLLSAYPRAFRLAEALLRLHKCVLECHQQGKHDAFE